MPVRSTVLLCKMLVRAYGRLSLAARSPQCKANMPVHVCSVAPGGCAAGVAAPIESASARRPGHIPAGEHVEVQVEHALPRLGADIGYHPVALQPQLPR